MAGVRFKRSNSKLTFDRDDQLRDDREDFSATLLQHVEGTLHRQESVGLMLLADSLKENGQVVVIVQLINSYFPLNDVLHAVGKRNR
jgi:hypothetical protein